jgi:hypothetical protein
MMNKTNKLNQEALSRAMRTMGYRDEHEAANYMWGYYRGLLNFLEKHCPGVEQALEVETYRVQGGGI